MSGIFAEMRFAEVADRIRNQIQQEVNGKTGDYLLGANEDDLILKQATANAV